MLSIDILDINIRTLVENHLKSCINDAYYRYTEEHKDSLSIEEKLQDMIDQLGIERVSEIIADSFIYKFL